MSKKKVRMLRYFSVMKEEQKECFRNGVAPLMDIYSIFSGGSPGDLGYMEEFVSEKELDERTKDGKEFEFSARAKKYIDGKCVGSGDAPNQG